MSGLELEKKSLSEQLGQQAGKIQNQVTEDSNRALLEKFKHSSNIAQDLSNLYSERPYAYARVMKQLNGVLGASKVRRLHSTVQENARKSQASAQEHKQTLKKSLLAADTTAPSQSTYELSFMGRNITVDLSTSDSDRTISCNNLQVPFLKNLHMSATARGTSVSDVTLSASLDADFLESSNVSLTFRKNRQGKYEVSGNADVATKVKIPGLEDIDVNFNFATGGQGGSMTATFDSATQMFGRVGGSASGSITLDGSGTQVNATVSLEGEAGEGVSGVVDEGVIPTSNLHMSGSVTFNTDGTTVTDASGNVEITGLGFVTDPSAPLALSVAYDGNEFSASLDKSLDLVPFTIPGTTDTILCTVYSASYSETEQFSASCHIDVSLWNDKFKADGPVTITNNSIDSCTLNIETGELAIPAQNSVLSGSASGMLSVVEGGFSGADITANMQINLGSAQGAINVDRLEINSSGGFEGNLSVGEGGFKIQDLANIPNMDIEFNSVEGITFADGHVELLTKNLKSDEGGLAVSYDEGVFSCSGGVQLYSGGEEAQTLMATSTLEMTLTRDAVSGSAAIEITSDFKIPDASSPLVVCAGSTANLSITNNVLDPISFNGDYKYGMSSNGAGEGGGDAASNGGAESESSSLAFEGSFLNCTYDINSGLFTGTASATLRSDLSVGSGKFTLDIPAATEVGDSSLTISFENSEPTQVSGTLQADASMKLKEKTLDVNATIADFSYDCKGKIFSGTVSCALLGDFQLFENNESGAQVTLKGDSCSIEAVVASNALSKLTLNAAANTTISNEKITGGTANFDVLLEQAVVDVDKGTVSIDNASVTSTDGFELNLHNGKTKIQIGADSQMSVGIADSKLKSFDVSGTITGSTSVFNTVDDVEFDSDAADFSATGLENGNLSIDTTANVKTTNTTRITEITSSGGGETKVDKIELLEGSNFDFGINQDVLSKLGGNLNFNFEKETPSTHLPKGYGFKLGGGINFDFTSTSLSGTTQTELTKDVEVVVGEGEGKQFKAEIHSGDQTNGSLGLENNAITSISVNANADLTVPTPGINNGETLINLNLDAATFNPQTLTFSCNDAAATLTNGLSLEVNHAGGRSTVVNVSENAAINVSVADNKVTGLSFNGDITGSTTILGQDKAIDFQINGSGLTLEGLGTDNIHLAGTAAIETTSPVALKNTEEETLTLLENSSISVDFGDEGVDSVGAHFIFDYTRGAQGNVSAYSLNLEGDVTYGISAETIAQGDVTGTLTSELVISPKAASENGSVTVTLHENNTAGLTIADGEITQFTYTGDSQFVVASKMLQTGDAIINVQVSNATLDLGEESTISGSAVATLENDIQLKVEHGEGSGKYTQIDIGGGATAGCTVDKNILMDVQFGANVSGKTTILGSDKEIDFVVTGDGVGIEGLGSEDLSLSGSVSITMTNESVTLKEDSVEKIDLLQDSSFTVDVGSEGIQTLTGQFYLDYTHAATANVPTGYQLHLEGDPTYDVQAKTISGTVSATVKEDISIMPPATADGSSISAIVRKDATADVTFESSDLKSLSCSGLTEVTINSPVLTSGPAVIDVTLDNASINAQTFEISVNNAQADLKTNLTVRANHGDDGRYTEVTIDQGASGSVALDNNIVTQASLNGHMHGETTILGADKLIMYTVDGSELGLKGLGTNDLSLDGSLTIVTDNDVTLLDEGEETIVLLQTSDFTVALADSSLDSLTGNFKLDYSHAATTLVPTGYQFHLEGDPTYHVKSRSISGSVTATVKEDISIMPPATADGSSISAIVRKDATANVTFESNEIQSLSCSGLTEVTINSPVLTSGPAVIDVTLDNANIDTQTFEISVANAQADLKTDLTVRANHGDDGRYTEVTIDQGAGGSVALENNIVTQASLNGHMHGETTILGADKLIMYTVDGSELGLKGLGTNDLSLDGSISIITDNDVTLMDEGEETVVLLKTSDFTVALADSSLDSVTGKFKLDYSHKPTEYISTGFGFLIDGTITYSIPEKAISGSTKGTLKDDVQIGKTSEGDAGAGISGTLYKDSTVEVDYSANVINTITYSGKSQVVAPAVGIVKNDVILNIDLSNASLDVQTFAVSVEEATAALQDPVTIRIEHDGGRYTEATIQGSASISAANNVLTKATMNGDISGETTIVGIDPIAYTVDGSGLTLEGLGSSDISINGELNIVTTSEAATLKQSNGETVKLLKDSYFGIDLAQSSIDAVHGGFNIDYEHEPTELIASGYGFIIKGDAEYKVASETLTGSLIGTLKDNVTIGSSDAEGAGISGILYKDATAEVDFNESTITQLSYTGDAQLTLPSDKIKSGRAIIDISVNNATLDTESFAVSVGEASASLAEPVEFSIEHSNGKHTDITADGAATVSIENNIVTNATLSGEVTGETSIFSKSDDNLLKFMVDGSGITLEGLGTPDLQFSGEIKIVTTEDFDIDAINSYEVKLLKDSKFGISLDNNSLDTVFGNFGVSFKKDADEKFTNGIYVKATGEMTYSFSDGTFDGSGTLELLDDLDFEVGKYSEDGGMSAGARISLKEGQTNATLVVNNEGLQSFNGEVGFEASTNLETKKASAAIELTNGHGSFDYDIAGKTLNSAEISATVGCTIEVSDKITVEAKEGSNFDASFDNDGIVEGNFSGGLQIAVSLGDNVASGTIEAADAATGSGISEQAVFDVTTEGLNYTKGVGFDGTVNVTCAHRTILGSFQHTSTTGDGQTTTEFEYGLGAADANAVGIDIVIENGAVNTIAGSAGLFLEQTAGMNEGEDPLRVHGDVSFDYDVQANNLRSASGKVTVDRKVLYTAQTGDTLILESSEVDLIVENNDVVSVSGEVNLALGDDQGEYLTFTSQGEFDCLNTKKVSGHVEVHLIREKELTKSKQGDATQSGGDTGGHALSFWVQPTGSTTFSIDIHENEIEKLSGSIGFMIKRDGSNFFGGTIEGTYQAETETEEESLDGHGDIRLHQDIGLPNEDNPLFVLATGSYGAAEITNSQVSNIEGELIVFVKGPVSADGQTANDIRVQANGRVNVASGMVEYFHGQAGLTGDYFPLGANVGLTHLEAAVTIENNELKKISGSAGIKYETEGVTISGDVETFEWEKTEGETPDKFNFLGSLDVTALQDKIHGRATVAYNTFENPNAAPTIDGELEYQITDWCRATVGVTFKDGGWDNPIINGAIDVENVEVMPGKQLLDMKQSIAVSANPVVAFVPIDIAAGVGFGLSASLDPITVSGHAEIKDFPIMHPQGIPEFELGINAGTAVNLTGTVAPFLRFGVGSPALFAAGLKITGAATLSATAAGAVEGKITGGEEGFGGELGLGLTIAGAVDLSVIPSFYVMCFGDEVLDQKITSWNFSFGELFNTSWGKTFKWSEANGMQTVDGGPAPQLNVSPQPLDVAAPVESADQVYNLGGGGASHDAPSGGQTTDGGESESLPGLTMPTAEEIGKDSIGKNTDGKKADDLPGFGSQIEDIQKIAKAADAIGQVVDVISTIVTGAMIGGPWGALGALLIMVLTGKITISKVIGWFNDIKGGVQAIKHIISDPEAFIKSLLPDWLVAIYDFFKTANDNSILDEVVKRIDDWVNGLGSPKKEILQPVIDFVRKQRDKIGEIAELLNGNAGDVMMGIFKIVGFGFSCIGDIIDMVGDMLSIFKGIVRKCIQSGTIYIHYKVAGSFLGVEDWVYTWKFEIPGLCNWSGGDDWWIVHGLHLLFSGCGLDYVKA